MMELIPVDIRNWWKEWEMRLIVLFSAFLQVMLITLGSRRKSIYHCYLRVMVWFAYLAADWAAILALGVVSNRLADIKQKTGSLSLNNQLAAFWAPLVLLHLGGPDSITAYSLEDNELWIRNLKTLVVKTGLTGYIYFLALTSSPLAALAAVLTAIGLIKYAERIRSLYLASKDTLRDFLLPRPESGPAYRRIMEGYSLKRDEGYLMKVDEVIEIDMPEDLFDGIDMPDDEKVSVLLQASRFFQIFRLLFVDLILKVSNLGSSRPLFMVMNSEDAFEIISIELSLMYDLLYTKAIVLYNSNWGIARRVITLSSTCAVIVFFSIQEWKKYLIVDVYITFSLLGVAVLMEFHSILQIISSDWTSIWLLKNQNSYKGRIIGSLQLSSYRLPRWSESVAQFSLLELYIRRQPWLAHSIPWLGQAEQMLQKLSCVSYKKFRYSMKDWIYTHLKDKVGHQDVSMISFNAGKILSIHNQHHMTWSADGIEFDQFIVIWHIATELCYFSDRLEMVKEHDVRKNCKRSRMVSRYLIYLLVMHPAMMPTGIGLLRYTVTSVEARRYFQEQRLLMEQKDQADQLAWQRIDDLLKGNWNGKEDCKACDRKHKSAPPEALCEASHWKHKSAMSQALCEASDWLVGQSSDIEPGVTRGEKSGSVISDACRLASQLNLINLATERWNLISKVWAEALFYSAYCCEGYEHAKRLSKGGELLTHVWLLMAHFGAYRLINTSQGPEVTKLHGK